MDTLLPYTTLFRSMGENVFGRPKSPVNRREYGPGQHGQRRKSKVSDFGIQLRAKQKLKGYYGDVTEKQFKQTFQQAERMKGEARSAEHTSELQSLMRISYAVFCLKQKNKQRH